MSKKVGLILGVLVSALAGARARPAGQRWNAQRARRLTRIRRVHRVAAVIILAFAIVHLGNHLLAVFSLDLHLVRRAQPSGDGWWHPLDRLAAAGLPTLYQRAAEVARKAGGDACGAASAAA